MKVVVPGTAWRPQINRDVCLACLTHTRRLCADRQLTPHTDDAVVSGEEWRGTQQVAWGAALRSAGSVNAAAAPAGASDGAILANAAYEPVPRPEVHQPVWEQHFQPLLLHPAGRLPVLRRAQPAADATTSAADASSDAADAGAGEIGRAHV